MKNLFILIGLILLSNTVFGIDSLLLSLKKRDYKRIDSISKTYKTVDEAISKISKYSHQADKARACYFFTSNYMTYCEDSVYKKLYKDVKYKNSFIKFGNEMRFVPIYEDGFKFAIIEKTGVCHEFSSLYKYICNSVGLDNIIVIGFVKSFGNSIALHSWNIVVIDGKKYICDVTMAHVKEGSINETYYLMPSEYAITEYFPTGAYHLLGFGMTASNNLEYYNMYKQAIDYNNETHAKFAYQQLIDKPITFECFLKTKVYCGVHYTTNIGSGSNKYTPLCVMPNNHENRYLKIKKEL